MTAGSGSEAVDNARRHASYEPGYCQKFVRLECWDVGSLYGSAIEAWNGAREKHSGDRTPPLGAPCYYSGGSYGHAVIFTGGDDIRSTDCQTTGKVSEDTISWPERAWGYKYLGWTGDINGVDLPLSGTGGDSNQEDDDMPDYDHATYSKDIALKADIWKVIDWQTASGAGNFRENETSLRVGGRAYSSVFHVQLQAPQGATIRLRTQEWNPETGDVQESNPQSETLATGGKSYAQHAQIGHCASDRRVRFVVSCTQDATILFADAVALSWG